MEGAPTLGSIRVGPHPPPGPTRPHRRRTIANGPSGESLSYRVDINRVALRAMRKEAAAPRRLYGYSGRTLAKLLTTVATGVIIGLTAVALSQSIENMVSLRDRWVRAAMSRHFSAEAPITSVLPALGLQLAVSLTAATGAAALVQLVAPKAAGAGVTLVMAYLNGNDIPDALTFRTYAVKFIGNVAARFAGLALGPEGPMIHLGACVASCLCAAEDRECADGADFRKWGFGDWLKGARAALMAETSAQCAIAAAVHSQSQFIP